MPPCDLFPFCNPLSCLLTLKSHALAPHLYDFYLFTWNILGNHMAPIERWYSRESNSGYCREKIWCRKKCLYNCLCLFSDNFAKYTQLAAYLFTSISGATPSILNTLFLRNIQFLYVMKSMLKRKFIVISNFNNYVNMTVYSMDIILGLF